MLAAKRAVWSRGLFTNFAQHAHASAQLSAAAIFLYWQAATAGRSTNLRPLRGLVVHCPSCSLSMGQLVGWDRTLGFAAVP